MEVSEDQVPRVVKVADLLKVTKRVDALEPKNRLVDAEEALRKVRIENDGREKFFKLRTHWSWVLTFCIGGMILFQIITVLLIGVGLAHFQEYPALLHVVFGENFLQIIGMGLVIVKFLYPDGRG